MKPKTTQSIMNRTINPAFRSLNRPLLLLGVDRRLFFFLLSSSLSLFELSGSPIPALVLFVALWAAARFAAQKDPRFLRIVLNSRRFSARYDPAKRCQPDVKGAA
jgi:type IV secretory pathway TrbD component